MTDDEIYAIHSNSMSREFTENGDVLNLDVIAFARSIVAAERERCAKVVRGLMVDGPTTIELVAGANIALGEALRKIRND